MIWNGPIGLILSFFIYLFIYLFLSFFIYLFTIPAVFVFFLYFVIVDVIVIIVGIESLSLPFSLPLITIR